jgi:hypothetical protein
MLFTVKYSYSYLNDLWFRMGLAYDMHMDMYRFYWENYDIIIWYTLFWFIVGLISLGVIRLVNKVRGK